MSPEPAARRPPTVSSPPVPEHPPRVTVDDLRQGGLYE